ncbi:hypothetical protein ACIGZJ_05185 [Kitasatospora sp. NPDC052868]|uniref:hypothetical protein n=1 Tax=Kitasatospora sp. NPDC052868 TaxID=3364060 RepID=UPI0037CA83E6
MALLLLGKTGRCPRGQARFSTPFRCLSSSWQFLDLPERKPLECRNGALDAENAERWRESFARLEAALADGATPARYVRHRLQQRREAVARFLDKHLPEASK